MKANNYEVAEAGETITFRGLVARSTSQAFFLTFCTALGMASLALVLQIQFQDLGKCNNEKKEYAYTYKQTHTHNTCYITWCIVNTDDLSMPPKLSSQLNQKSNITVLPGIGSPNWFYLCLLSPYAGIYYWKSGDRVDDMKVKLATNDDDTLNEVTIEGNDEEIERM